MGITFSSAVMSFSYVFIHKVDMYLICNMMGSPSMIIIGRAGCLNVGMLFNGKLFNQVQCNFASYYGTCFISSCKRKWHETTVKNNEVAGLVLNKRLQGSHTPPP